MLDSIYLAIRLYYKINKCHFNIITSNLMYLNAGVKMHEKVAALKCGTLHTIKTTFSKTTIFKHEV